MDTERDLQEPAEFDVTGGIVTVAGLLDLMVEVDGEQEVAKPNWQERINADTPKDYLHKIVRTAERTGDKDIVRAAALAKAELDRREQERKAEEQERRAADQAAEREFQKKLVAPANRSAKSAARAAWVAAIAAILTFLLALLGYFSEMFHAPPDPADQGPPISKQQQQP